MSHTAPAPHPLDDRYRWAIQLRQPNKSNELTASTMTAAEQMFFLGAPLAHVVAYEKLLKIRRLLKPPLSAGRLTRLAVRRAAPADPMALAAAP